MLPRATNVAPSASVAAERLGEGYCAWYDVARLRWRPHAARFSERDTRMWPRLGALMGRSAINGTVCDGYGSREFGERPVLVRCVQCPGEPYARDRWSVLQCSAKPLVPAQLLAPPESGVAEVATLASLTASPLATSPVDVLLVISDHNNHGLFAQVSANSTCLSRQAGRPPHLRARPRPRPRPRFASPSLRIGRAAQVERVLNQLHLAATRGLTPHVFLGQKVFNAPDACDVGENQYFEASRGDNVWDYYFEPVSPYRSGDATLEGRPVRERAPPRARTAPRAHPLTRSGTWAGRCRQGSLSSGAAAGAPALCVGR